MMCTTSFPTSHHGSFPVESINNVHPSDQMSVCLRDSNVVVSPQLVLLNRISGAINAKVPTGTSVSWVNPELSYDFAVPKSESFTSPVSETRMFAGFIS